MFNAALTTAAIDVDLPHCDAADERSQQREKSRHGRYLPQCCRGDTQASRNRLVLRPRWLESSPRHAIIAPSCDRGGRISRATSPRREQSISRPNLGCAAQADRTGRISRLRRRRRPGEARTRGYATPATPGEAVLTPAPPPCAAPPSCGRWDRAASCAAVSLSG